MSRVTEAIELDPFGGETNRSTNQYIQSHRFTTWERDWTGDESLFRRYHGWWSRFAHPDPYDGSYQPGDPQSLNRYSYVKNDPVNFIDPTGLWCGYVRHVYTVQDGVNPDGIYVQYEWECHDDPIIITLLGGSGNEPRGGGFGGNPFLPPPNPRPQPQQQTQPCDPPGSIGAGQFNYDWNPQVVGGTAGAHLDNKFLYPYAGVIVGTPSTPFGSGSITAGNYGVTPGLNYQISISPAIMQFSWSGRLDVHNIRGSLKNGSFSFGGSFPWVPNATASVTYVGQVRLRCH